MKRVVLLGGGHAHLQVLTEFAAAPAAGAALTLVSPFPALSYSGMVAGVVAGHYRADEGLIPLRPLASAAGAAFVEASATALDAVTRRITLSNGAVLGYDVLSIDTGSAAPRQAIPGAAEHALFVRPLAHFTRLWAEVRALAEQRPLRLVVIGGGAGGCELALAMQHALGRPAGGSRVSLVTGGRAPLAAHPPAVQTRMRRALQRARITVLEQACVGIGAGQVELASGLRLACDAPVLATGAAAPEWLRGSGLALDDAGFIASGPTLQSSSHAEVFAAGDVASRADAPQPKSAEYALRAGPPLAFNLRRFIGGGDLQPCLPQRRALALLACGEQRAIASWGRWALQGRWVWRWKNHIDRAFVARYGGGSPDPPESKV